MRTGRSFVLAGLFWASAAGLAHAGACDARFLREGGNVQVRGSGVIRLDADLNFSDVRKRGPDSCSAHVRGSASYQLLGLPGGEATLDHAMDVIDGRSSFVRTGSTGGGGKSFDLRLLGLFGYPESALREGARLAGETIQLEIGDGGASGLPPTVVRIGEKIVGDRQAMDTALGRQSCWPIRYERNTEPTVATFGGLAIPVPALRSQVTDWYCPDAQLVMKQEILQAGQTAVIEVTAVK